MVGKGSSLAGHLGLRHNTEAWNLPSIIQQKAVQVHHPQTNQWQEAAQAYCIPALPPHTPSSRGKPNYPPLGELAETEEVLTLHPTEPGSILSHSYLPALGGLGELSLQHQQNQLEAPVAPDKQNRPEEECRALKTKLSLELQPMKIGQDVLTPKQVDCRLK